LTAGNVESEFVDGVVGKTDVHDDVVDDVSEGEMGAMSVDFEGLSVSFRRSGSNREDVGDA